MATRAPKPIFTQFYRSADQLPALLTRQEVACWFRVSEITVDNWRRSGILNPVKIENTLRYRKEEVMNIST